MPRTTMKPAKRQNGGKNANTAKQPAVAPTVRDVLALAEAAAYLRLSEDDVLRLVDGQGLLGRQIGAEWRFLKSALQDWLRTPATKGSKEAFLSIIGSWKEDPYLDEMLKEIYRQRGRPMTEDGE